MGGSEKEKGVQCSTRKLVGRDDRRSAEDRRMHSFGFKVYKIKMLRQQHITRYSSPSGGLYMQRKNVLKHCTMMHKLSVLFGLSYAECSGVIEDNDGSLSACTRQLSAAVPEDVETCAVLASFDKEDELKCFMRDADTETDTDTVLLVSPSRVDDLNADDTLMNGCDEQDIIECFEQSDDEECLFRIGSCAAMGRVRVTTTTTSLHPQAPSSMLRL